LAATLAIVAGAALWHGVASKRDVEPAAHYATVVGAQQTYALPDGTEVQLNTDTALAVNFTAGERRVTLERGEAFFHVARNPARPFIVTAGGTETRVLGTQFVVRLGAHETEVVVAEGHVAFGATGASPASLTAAQRAVLGAGATAAPRVATLDPASLARRLAWRSGRLDFKEVPLREVIAEFNRYNARKIVLRDPETEMIGITGAWDVANIDGLEFALAKSVDVVEVRRSADEIVLGMRR
jgi:transmembrane sensor